MDHVRLDHIKDVQEEVERMSALVAELLLFSKAGMQPAQVRLASVDVAETVRRAVLRESNPAVSVTVSVDDQLKVVADDEYLTRALSNLVRNSIRYAGTRGPIHVSARTEETPDIPLKVAALV